MQQEIRYLFNEILVLSWACIGFGLGLDWVCSPSLKLWRIFDFGVLKLALFGFVPFLVFGCEVL